MAYNCILLIIYIVNMFFRIDYVVISVMLSWLMAKNLATDQWEVDC